MVTYLLIGWRHYDVIGWRHKTTSGGAEPPYSQYFSEFISRLYLCTWNVCLVRVRYCGMMCHPLIFTSWTLSPVITLSLPIFWLVPLWMATTVCIYFRFRQVLFRYVRVIAYVFCHAGVLVCLFVVNVANFWYDVIENRLSNSKLHCEFMVLYFWLLSFVWDPSISFQSHFCCSY